MNYNFMNISKKADKYIVISILFLATLLFSCDKSKDLKWNLERLNNKDNKALDDFYYPIFINKCESIELFTTNIFSLNVSGLKWVIEKGFDGNCLKTSSACQGGSIKFNISLPKKTKMCFWVFEEIVGCGLSEGVCNWKNPIVYVNDVIQENEILSGNKSDWTRFITINELKAGNNFIKIEFPEGFYEYNTTKIYYVDEISFLTLK